VRILDALAAQDAKSLIAVADEMEGASLSFAAALSDLATLLSRVAVAQADPSAVSEDTPDRDDLMRLAGALGPEDVQLFYQIAIHGRNDLPYAPDERTGFVMSLLRMLAFRPDEGGTAVAEPAPRAAAAPPRTAARPAAAPSSSAASAPSAGAPAAGAARAEPAPAPERAMATGSFDGDWPALIARLPLTGFVRTWANKSEMLSFEAGVFTLRVPTRVLADDKSMQEKLRGVLEQFLGRPVRLAVQVGEMSGASVAAITAKSDDIRQKAAEESIMADPFVREMVEQTGAKPTDIRPSGK
jgi:DNA polymerase-3 subunit gamma/tau